MPRPLSTLAITTCGFLAACDRVSDVRRPDAGAYNIIELEYGDGQVFPQHTQSDVLQVRVLDSVSGWPIPDVPVTFEAAPGSDVSFSQSSTTNRSGLAHADRRYVHVAGPLQIVASSPDIVPATFSLEVTPSTHPYDGVYDCGGFDTPYGALSPLTMVDGTFSSGPPHGVTSTSLDESTGALDVLVQVSNDNFVRMTGQLVLDSSQNASGSGLWSFGWHGAPEPTDPTKTWTCDRR